MADEERRDEELERNRSEEEKYWDETRPNQGQPGDQPMGDDIGGIREDAEQYWDETKSDVREAGDEVMGDRDQSTDEELDRKLRDDDEDNL
jgi:hypothetical protein